MNRMYEYLQSHNYISKNDNKNPLRQQELSKERAEAIACKCENIIKEKNQEFRNKLKEKLINYFDIYKDCYFYVLTRDKTAFQYGTMTFNDFKGFDEEQIEDIINFIFNEGK